MPKIQLTLLMAAVQFGIVFSVRSAPSGTSDEYNNQFVKMCENYIDRVKNLPGFNQFKDKGELASPKEFPFTVILGYGSGVLTLWLCGGTLITTRYVLSAAHCTHHPKAGPATTALLGELDGGTNDDETTSKYMDISVIIKHPDYRKHGMNNLALFQLTQDSPVTLYIRPVCLLAQRQTNLENFWAPGWGFTPDNPFALVKNFHMKKNKKLANDRNTGCGNSLGSSIARERTNEFFCFSNLGTKSPCQIDSGGGLLSPDKINGISIMNLVGVRTDRSCKNVSTFIDLQYFVPWIAQHVFNFTRG